jgi:hypothetical protein
MEADIYIATRRVLNERIFKSEKIYFAGVCKPMFTKGCRRKWQVG